MCTVIPTEKTYEGITAVPIPSDVFRHLLQCVEICGKVPTGSRDIVDLTAEVDSADLDAIIKRMEQSVNNGRGACTFLVKDAHLFVMCLTSVMYWHLTHSNHGDVRFLVEAPDFDRPMHWSYRYFWRYLSRTVSQGVSIDHVRAVAEMAARFCNVDV